jgi:hypothetical protein
MSRHRGLGVLVFAALVVCLWADAPGSAQTLDRIVTSYQLQSSTWL